MTYSFQEQLAIGERDEDRLDRHFGQFFSIDKATAAEQRQGIDRHFIGKERKFTVEYKSDHRAFETGNAFVETVSVDTKNTPGWIYTSKASYLFYFMPDADLCYILTFLKLRNRLRKWLALYPTCSIPNRGYCTEGMIVPLYEFERGAIATVEIAA